jgi:Leucine-rich repeat (LRR) protein
MEWRQGMKRLVVWIGAAFAVLGSVPVAGDIPPAERAALVAIYNATSGAIWTHKAGWLGEPGTECTWERVTCSADGSTVERLGLSNNHLAGRLPREIGDLPNLVSLGLSSNPLLWGEIPVEIGRLTRLQWLWISDCALSGGLPHEVGQLAELVSLRLARNALSGPLPDEIGALVNLETLDLRANAFASIPSTIGNLGRLKMLDLGWNAISSLPSQLGDLRSLEEAYFEYNQTGGPIPSTLGNLVNVRTLRLVGNQLSGPLPATMGAMSNLEVLEAGLNPLGGAIPAEFGGLSKLRVLDLSWDRLTGPIPESLGNLANLEDLNLAWNELSGPLPPGLGRAGSLTMLRLHDNRLEGSIPQEWAGMSRLWSLSLNRNALSGPFPATLCDLTWLNDAALDANAFAGEVPRCVLRLTALQQGGAMSLPVLFNALYTHDSEVNDFLVRFNGGRWDLSQTVAPAGTAAAPVSPTEIGVSWVAATLAPELPGGYEVVCRRGATDPDPLVLEVPGRASTSATVPGLTPGGTYLVSVRSYTLPSDANPNRVVSEPGDEIQVQLPAAPTLAFDETTTTLFEGYSRGLRLALGAVQDVPIGARLRSSDPRVATVPDWAMFQPGTSSLELMLFGLGPGRTTIRATLPEEYGGTSATIDVLVEAIDPARPPRQIRRAIPRRP